MATTRNVDDRTDLVVLSRKEAANLVTLLVGQLADEPVRGNQAGEAPIIRIVEDGRAVKLLAFVVEPAKNAQAG